MHERDTFLTVLQRVINIFKIYLEQCLEYKH